MGLPLESTQRAGAREEGRDRNEQVSSIPHRAAGHPALYDTVFSLRGKQDLAPNSRAGLFSLSPQGTQPFMMSYPAQNFPKLVTSWWQFQGGHSGAMIDCNQQGCFPPYSTLLCKDGSEEILSTKRLQTRAGIWSVQPAGHTAHEIIVLALPRH